MATTKRRYSKDDFAQRGDAIYENDIRPRLKPDDEGKYVAIDIDTKNYEIDGDELFACDQLRARHPDAQIWLVKVGSRYLHRFGGRDPRGRFMISGIVRGREALVQISIYGPDGHEHTIDAVIDTGYTASLSLPPSVIQSLDLHWRSTGRGILADGSECLFDVFECDVEWDGQRLRILVDEADTDPLIGMRLLDGFELNIAVRSGGAVTIRPFD